MSWTHGASGYTNYGCRCPVCREGHRAAHVRYQAERARRAPCRVEGCEGGLYARGLCKAHWERQRTGRPLDAPLHRRPNAHGPQPGKRLVRP